eukprot:GHVO01005665.1.p2 GENE.GHVO01005665.1~~GHVO01005665.1.p2  ORF type:complete len:108 (+),score=21.73 GHVO01005665.1:29-325(+)
MVDFVMQRIDRLPKMSDLLGELFEGLISPGPWVSENGCDNMSAILIDFKAMERSTRRQAEAVEESVKKVGQAARRMKIMNSDDEEMAQALLNGWRDLC